jgi:hypothetical protein
MVNVIAGDGVTSETKPNAPKEANVQRGSATMIADNTTIQRFRLTGIFSWHLFES